VLAQLIIQWLYNLLTHVLFIAGMDGLADVFGYLVADPKFGARFRPVKQPVGILGKEFRSTFQLMIMKNPGKL
jgi:hypothetical protein